MRRSPMPRGKGFKRKEIVRTPPSAPTPVRGGVVTSAAGMNPVVEKNPRYVDKALTDMAKGRPCLLRFPEFHIHDTTTTVACHSNWSDLGGKGGHRKADDTYSVWGCGLCHTELDQGTMVDGEEKRRRWLAAWELQLQHWARIAKDKGERRRFQVAAGGALIRLSGDERATRSSTGPAASP